MSHIFLTTSTQLGRFTPTHWLIKRITDINYEALPDVWPHQLSPWIKALNFKTSTNLLRTIYLKSIDKQVCSQKFSSIYYSFLTMLDLRLWSTAEIGWFVKWWVEPIKGKVSEAASRDAAEPLKCGEGRWRACWANSSQDNKCGWARPLVP